ncbi:hypothetical protein ABZX12_26905 [Kribbella sp. NPDC003505]|uniref:hypothetical protein n=1 Tax=Kribbella sp. NPDC003505 TaxID=3154448 RepID=UPI0033A59A6F
MSKDSLGDKLERQVENLKTGLKDVAHKFTAPDPDPHTEGTAAAITRARVRVRGREPSKDELYADAKRLGIKGRSKMTKAELAKAVRRSS